MRQSLDIPNEGAYARKRLHSKSRVISFSHLRRFQAGLDLVVPHATGKRILDYGCGDGTFIHTLLAAECAPLEVTGAEISDKLIEDCRTRFSPRPKALLDQLHSLLSENRMLIISVPVETGVVLLFKQAVRIVAGWRGIGDYRWASRHTLAEYWKSLFAGSAAHIDRPVHRPPHFLPCHCHKGFNWRWLQLKIAGRFEIQQVFGSPLKGFPPALSSQVWFEARRRPASA